MRPWRGKTLSQLSVAAALIACLLLCAPAALASGGAGDAKAAKAKRHKPRKKKCRKNQVKVRFGKRVKCLPLKAALPKPSAVDPRIAIVKEGLTPEIGRVPDPKNKIPPPAEKLYRKLNPKALKGMERAVGIAVGRLDAMGGGRAGASAIGGARLSTGGGGSFSVTIGGVRVDARLSIAVEATGQLVGTAELTETRDQGGGRTVSVTTRIPIRLEHMGFEARSGGCPTSEGKVNATDGIGITIQTEFRSNNGKTLEEYFIYEVADDTDPLQGIVADDAKLDTLEIKSIEDVTEKAGGSVFGGSVVHASIVRNTVVDMRTGEYDPHVSLVNVGVVLGGVLRIFQPFVQPLVAERLKKAADKGFAATVDFEMKQFRELEEKWNTPNRCAKLKFDRANESLTLKRNQSGDETVRLDAAPGGSPTKADWTIGGQENGEFSLSDHSANPTKFHWKVTSAGEGKKLRGTFRATSKAGVAEETWSQRTEAQSLDEIEGTFGGEFLGETALEEPSVQKWSGSVKFHRLGSFEGSDLFTATSGNVSISASGIEQSGITGCHQSGSAQGPLSGGGMTVTGKGPEGGAPYEYDLQLNMPFMAIDATRVASCPKAAQDEGYEGTHFELTPFWQLGAENQESADGLSFVGSQEETFGSVTFRESWTLHAKP
ncbi:MAG TPA: hypothetical protein VGF04_00600 [Solirubrobacterales bacterium]|jgi:hypothetical protein